MKKINKIALFYNNYRGYYLLQKLKKEGYQITKILAKKNLNRKVQKLTRSNKIIKNLKSKEFLKFIKSKSFDLFILAGFPYIFPKKLISIPKYGVINLHGGKLPKYRGGSPLSWQIINNEKKIGLSVIRINEKIDEGEIINEKSFKNLKTDTILEVQKKSFKIFNKLTSDAIKILEKGKKLKKQKKSDSYFFQRTDKDSKINWKNNAKDVYNFIRAISYPYKGAYTYLFKTKIRIIKSKISKNCPKIVNVGDFFKDSNKNLYVKCKINSIKILKSEPKVKKLILKNNKKLCVV
tara:strand:+ start:1021 stop:1899 length:879 start_codon:yes stop_codon:yes gene_type:complete